MTFHPESAELFYREAYQTLRDTEEIPDFSVEYYPYVNTNHTIRYRNRTIYVRISDTFKDAPAKVHRSLAFILVGKLTGKALPPQMRRIYRNFVKSEVFQKVALDNKRKKGRKQIGSPVGTRFDLNSIFDHLNEIYFKDALTKPTLSWSKRPTYRRLGHHDPAHQTIIISKTLDDERVPQYVVEYIMFHEMLHIVHPAVFRNGRRLVHTAEFQRDERRFKYYQKAEDWIERNARHFKKMAGNK